MNMDVSFLPYSHYPGNCLCYIFSVPNKPQSMCNHVDNFACVRKKESECVCV